MPGKCHLWIVEIFSSLSTRNYSLLMCSLGKDYTLLQDLNKCDWRKLKMLADYSLLVSKLSFSRPF